MLVPPIRGALVGATAVWLLACGPAPDRDPRPIVPGHPAFALEVVVDGARSVEAVGPETEGASAAIVWKAGREDGRVGPRAAGGEARVELAGPPPESAFANDLVDRTTAVGHVEPRVAYGFVALAPEAPADGAAIALGSLPAVAPDRMLVYAEADLAEDTLARALFGPLGAGFHLLAVHPTGRVSDVPAAWVGEDIEGVCIETYRTPCEIEGHAFWVGLDHVVEETSFADPATVIRGARPAEFPW